MERRPRGVDAGLGVRDRSSRRSRLAPAQESDSAPAMPTVACSHDEDHSPRSPRPGPCAARCRRAHSAGAGREGRPQRVASAVALPCATRTEPGRTSCPTQTRQNARTPIKSEDPHNSLLNPKANRFSGNHPRRRALSAWHRRLTNHRPGNVLPCRPRHFHLDQASRAISFLVPCLLILVCRLNQSTIQSRTGPANAGPQALRHDQGAGLGSAGAARRVLASRRNSASMAAAPWRASSRRTMKWPRAMFWK